MVHINYELNNQMSEQVPISTLVTLKVFNTSVTIYSNDLTKTKKTWHYKAQKHQKNKKHKSNKKTLNFF